MRDVISTTLKKKNPGTDRIRYEYAQGFPKKLLLHLLSIYNQCLYLGYLPDKWKQAKIILIPKIREDVEIPEKGRSISLLPSMGKVFQEIILRRLVSHLDYRKLIRPDQYGIRSHHLACQESLWLAKASKSTFLQEKEPLLPLFWILPKPSIPCATAYFPSY